MSRRKSQRVEPGKSTSCVYTITLTLPYSITDTIQEQRTGDTCLFLANNDKGDQLEVFGRQLDSEHFTLRFTGSSTVDPSVCHLQDSITLTSGTHKPDKRNSSARTISQRCIFKQDTTSEGDVSTPEVNSVENSSYEEENVTRKSSRIKKKYGDGHSIAWKLTKGTRKTQVKLKVETSDYLDVSNKQSLNEQGYEESLCGVSEKEKLKMDSEKWRDAETFTSQAQVKSDLELPDTSNQEHRTEFLEKELSELMKSDISVATSYLNDVAVNSQDSVLAAVNELSSAEQSIVSSTGEEKQNLTVSNETLKFDDELHVSKEPKFVAEGHKNHDDKCRDSKVTACQRKKPSLDYQCKLCPHFTSCRRAFKSHLRQSHSRNLTQYKREFRLNPDLTTTSIPQDFECDKSTTKRDHGEEHCITHNIPENFQLPDVKVSQDFNLGRAQYKDPRSDHSQEKGFSCNLCGSAFSVLTHLSLHLKRKHSQDPQSRSQLLAIQEHRWSKVTGTMYQCLFCKKSYVGKRVVRHMKLAHTDEPDLDNYIGIALSSLGKETYNKKRAQHLSVKVCPHCNKQIKQCSLKRHIDNHCKQNNSIRRRYDCHMCGFYSYDLEACRQHKASVHAERQTFICETCAGSFSTASGLTYHRRVKHGVFKKKPVRVRECPECGKQFERKSSFDRHLQTHEKYRTSGLGVKWSCHICGKSFKDKHGLTYHVKTIHEGSYPYSCDKCGHGFGRKSNLLSHQCGRSRRITENSLQNKLQQVQNEATQLEMLTKVDTIGMEPSHSQNELSERDTEALENEMMTKVETVDSIEPSSSVFFSPGALQDVHDMVIIQPSGSGTFTLGEGDDSMYVVVDTVKDGSADGQPTLVRLADGDNLDQSGMYTIIEAAAAAEF